MKCPHCGSPLGLEDEFCPYCNLRNEFFVKHQESMKKYNRAFRRTQSDVYEKAHKAASLTAPIVILLILLLLNIAALIFVRSSWDIGRSIQINRIESHLTTHQENIANLLETADYIGFAKYYDQNILYYSDHFDSYQAIQTAANAYSNLYQILADQSENRTYHFSDEALSNTLKVLSSYLDTLYSLEDTYLYNAEILFSEENRVYIEDIKDQTNALLICYAGLTAKETSSLPDLSRSKKEEVLERGIHSL